MTKIDRLKDKRHYDEIEEDGGTGRIEETRIMCLVDKDSSFRKIQTKLRQGTYAMDTFHEFDYYYKGEDVIFMSIRETICNSSDTTVLHDCDYYFDNQKLISNECSSGKPKKTKFLLTTSRFHLTAVEQLMKTEN